MEMMNKMTTLSMILLLLKEILTDPASELAEMEEIMMTLFPYAMVLNPRKAQY